MNKRQRTFCGGRTALSCRSPAKSQAGRGLHSGVARVAAARRSGLDASDLRVLEAVASLVPESEFAALVLGLKASIEVASLSGETPQPVQPPSREVLKCTHLRGLQPMERFEGRYRLRNPQRLIRRDGAQYWQFVLADDTGWLRCYVWPEQCEPAAGLLSEGEVFVEARARSFDGRLVADILSMAPAAG